MAYRSRYWDRVLVYVEEHPNCSVRDVAEGLAIRNGAARDVLNALYAARLIGRQATLFGPCSSHELHYMAEVRP